MGLNKRSMKTIGYPFQDSDRTEIREVLTRDGIMVFPTETFYAIGCLATSSAAVERIYALKQRQKGAPLLVLIDSWKMLEKYADGLTAKVCKTLQHYWPGALTAVLPQKGGLAAELNAPGETLGFRLTSSAIACELIQTVGLPLVGTSANISSTSEISEFNRTREIFGSRVQLYIDGGETRGGLPSTVVDMTDDNRFSVLRQGSLDFEPDAG